MADDTALPIFTKIEHKANPAAESAFKAEVDKLLASGKRSLDAFGQDARKTLDAALAVSRNKSGSLDLGVPQLKEAAAAQQQRAQAAEEVYRATVLAARAEKDYSQATRQAIAATKALATEEKAAATAALNHANAAEAVQRELNQTASSTNLVINATKQGTTANKLMAGSTAGVRIASLQAGQQLQDMAISIYSGQRASIVFAQQLPQLAFAMTSLEGSTNKTLDRLGKFGTFLSGPLGLVVGLGVGVLGSYVASLLSVGEASDEAKDKTFDFSKGLDVVALSADRATDAMRQLVEETKNAIKVQGDYLQQKGLIADESVSAIQGRIDKRNRQIADLRNGPAVRYEFNPGAPGFGTDVGKAQIEATLRAQNRTDQALLVIAQQAQTNSDIALAQQRAIEAQNPKEKIRGDFERAVGKLNNALEKSRTDPIGATQEGIFITEAGYEKEFARLNKLKEDALEAQKEVAKGASAAAQASLGDMQALIKQLFPGAKITSTTGGMHKKGSDHYAGRAIDFIPGGGMGQYTTAEVEQILRDAGVDIRRNAKGTQQLFGPGRSADKPGDHDDHFHLAWQGQAPDPARVAEATKKAEDLLKDFGDRAAESIARVNSQFDESPKLIDQAMRATRTLDQTIDDLADKKPIGFEQMIEDAKAAKQTIQDALVRPIEQMREETERQQQVQELLLQGREEEAAAVQAVWALEAKLGKEEDLRLQVQDLIAAGRKDEAAALQQLLDLYPGLKREAADLAAGEAEYNRQLRIRQDIQNDYLNATRSLRSELEGMFMGEKPDFGRIFKELQAKTTVEALFGPALRELDQFVKNGGVEDSVTYMSAQTNRAGEAAMDFANVLHAASAAIASGKPVSAATGAANDNAIVVTRDGPRSVFQLSPEEYFQRAAKALMTPLLGPLEEIGGAKFAQQVTSVVGGVLYGSASAGTVGGVLGGLKAVTDEIAKGGDKTAGAISDKLGKALGGAQTGTQVASIAKALGFEKFSTTGAQIGGAIGGAFFGPLGELGGSILGGIFGSFFKKAKQTYADFGGLGAGQYSVGGGSKYTDQANSLAKGVLDGLNELTDAFGATLSDFNLKIGVRDGRYRVDPTGNASFKNSIDFGEDGAAAIAFAIQDAIKDGALAGLSASIKNILTKEGSDLQAQLQKALDFQSVFDRLKAYKDPVGSAIDVLDKEFRRLRGIFEEAGASTEEYAQLEELYQIERTKAVEEAVKALSGALQSLYDDLTVNNSALSLRERQATAQAEYDALKARVEAGDTTAYDDYAEAARTLLDIERQIYGSQQQYFDLLSEVTATTKSTLDQINAQAAASAANAANPLTAGPGVPVNDNTNVVSAIGDTNAKLDAANRNLGLIATILAQQNGTTTPTAAQVSNF